MNAGGLKNLKQAEIFSLLAMMFLLMIGYDRVARGDISAVGSQTGPLFPPSIPIPSDDLSFETAKAFPKGGPADLKNYIEAQVVPKIEQQLAAYDVDMIEVVGHADGSPLNSRGNLDGALLSELARSDLQAMSFDEMVNKFGNLQAGSNTDLGLIRALIVVKTLEDLQREGKCDCDVAAFRAYSAGQLYLPGAEPLAAPPDQSSNESRRRIEIRFTKWNP